MGNWNESEVENDQISEDLIKIVEWTQGTLSVPVFYVVMSLIIYFPLKNKFLQFRQLLQLLQAVPGSTNLHFFK